MCPPGGIAPGSAPVPAACPQVAHLKACFSFDADTASGNNTWTVRDGAPGGTHGTGTGLTYVDDLDGRAAVFNGNARVDVVDADSHDTPGAITMEAWIFPTQLPPNTGNARAGILDKDGQYGMFLMATGELRCSGGGPVITGLTIPLNTWSHVACAYDGSVMRMFLNGVAGPTQAQNGMLAVGGAGLFAVGGNAPSGDNFVGKLDRVRVWSAARTAEQVCLSQP